MANFRKNLHRTLTGFMAIWLSGVVFLLCCHVQNVNAAEMGSCPLAKLGIHCDKAEKNKDSEKISNQSNDQGMDCCGFIIRAMPFHSSSKLLLFFSNSAAVLTNI